MSKKKVKEDKKNFDPREICSQRVGCSCYRCSREVSPNCRQVPECGCGHCW